MIRVISLKSPHNRLSSNLSDGKIQLTAYADNLPATITTSQNYSSLPITITTAPVIQAIVATIHIL
jgi:hypothetical protein